MFLIAILVTKLDRNYLMLLQFSDLNCVVLFSHRMEAKRYPLLFLLLSNRWPLYRITVYYTALIITALILELSWFCRRENFTSRNLKIFCRPVVFFCFFPHYCFFYFILFINQLSIIMKFNMKTISLDRYVYVLCSSSQQYLSWYYFNISIK